MSAVTNLNCCRFLLLVVLPVALHAHPIPLPTDQSKEINPLKDVIETVLQQKPAETLLLLNRRQNGECNWRHLQFINIPIIRLDEFTTFEVKESFSNELLAVVCISELADSMLLTSLAKDLHRMREARVIVWLKNIKSNLKAYLNIIIDHASSSNFLNLLVMQRSERDGNKSLETYRLQPFPFPTLTRVADFKSGEIYPKYWKNFQNKTAVAMPNLHPPISYIRKDKKTGKKYLRGFMDKQIMEFAKKYNINLKLLNPLDTIDNESTFKRDIFQMTASGKIDLSMHAYKWQPNLECSNVLGLSNLFVVVPCGDVMGVGNIIRGLKTYFLCVLCVYFSFSVIETLIVAVSCRIYGRRYRFSWANLFINLNSFRWVLGLPININRNRRSTSLHQIIMIMSVFSLIITCFFNANFSTFFTKRPTDDKITNFDELRDSGLKILFDKSFRNFILDYLKKPPFRIDAEQIEFLSGNEKNKLLFDQNTSYAYEMFSKIWDTFDRYQKYYNRKTLCRHSGLDLHGAIPFHAIFQNNSVYRKAFNDYVYWAQDLGYSTHWTIQAIDSIEEFSIRGKTTWHPTSLSLMDLKWVWHLFGLCYAASILVFIAEVLIAYRQRRRVARVVIIV